MDIEVGYFPKSYYSSTPNDGGFFPFTLEDEINYVFDISGFYLPEWTGNLEGDIRETVIVNMEADTSVFWIGYDGYSIATISNQLQFSTYEKITQTFPRFVSPKHSNYDEV